MEEIESPCIKICKYDRNGVCMGCRRTRAEVGDWLKYTNVQKKEALDNANQREIVEDESNGFFF
jgi:uncharacterized protein